MYIPSRSKLSVAFSLLTFVAVGAMILSMWVFHDTASVAHAATAAPSHTFMNCARSAFCTEVADPEPIFGEGNYVGHDEPSTLFYSNVPGAGNRAKWDLTLPKDPTATNPLAVGKSYNFELHAAFWFGMAMCDTQSYPELLSTCTPDSDKNIVDPALSPNHPGTAFMEMQFYPPGWVPFQNPGGISCDKTKWCAALNIDSLSQNPVTGQVNNATCANQIGLEYVNFAFITRSGHAQAPASPVNATAATFTPDSTKDLFMNSGDQVAVTMHDTSNGLKIELNDGTTGQSGSMTASIANGFGQVKFDPNGKGCTNIPYDFHPMYSTSSELTRVPWTAHAYNVAFADETGHFDFCNGTNSITPGASCPKGNTEGISGDQEATDGNDNLCYPGSAALLVQVGGCADANGGTGNNNPGFDGPEYQPVWPDGNTKLRPTPIRFTSPLTGDGYDVNYSRFAFEADLPRIEFSAGVCNRGTGSGCTLLPETDDGAAAVFYPFFSTRNVDGQCVWQLGNHIPGNINDFHQNQQYGTLLNLTYTNGNGTESLYEDFRQIFNNNPCKA